MTNSAWQICMDKRRSRYVNSDLDRTREEARTPKRQKTKKSVPRATHEASQVRAPNFLPVAIPLGQTGSMATSSCIQKPTTYKTKIEPSPKCMLRQENT